MHCIRDPMSDGLRKGLAVGEVETVHVVVWFVEGVVFDL
jgi:hypothetical protein